RLTDDATAARMSRARPWSGLPRTGKAAYAGARLDGLGECQGDDGEQKEEAQSEAKLGHDPPRRGAIDPHATSHIHNHVQPTQRGTRGGRSVSTRRFLERELGTGPY